MKNVIIVVLLLCGISVSNAQTKQPTEAEKILKDLYGDKKAVSDNSDNAESPHTVENSEIFRDWFLASLEGWLLILTPENNTSYKRSKDVQYLPGLKVENSIFSIASLLDDMDLEIKKDKIKATFIAINYLTGKEKKLTSMKIVNDIFYKWIGNKSQITKEVFNPEVNSILIYLKEETYHTIAFSKDEDITENISRIPNNASAFLIQRNLESEKYNYSLVGVYDGQSGEMILFKSSTVESMKKI